MEDQLNTGNLKVIVKVRMCIVTESDIKLYYSTVSARREHRSRNCTFNGS